MTFPQPPVAVTVEVPVSGGDAPIEVTITLVARRADPAPEPVDEPDLRVPPPPTPSAVVGRSGIAGIHRPAN